MSRGFSLVELMVSVAIVGILASIGVMNYDILSARAKYRATLATMVGISQSVIGLRYADDKFLFQISGSTCTTCDGNPALSWTNIGLPSQPMDAWGNPIQMDENEGEFGTDDCRRDSLWTYGYDKVFAGIGSGYDAYGDDLIFRIPWYIKHTCTTQELWSVGPSYKY